MGGSPGVAGNQAVGGGNGVVGGSGVTGGAAGVAAGGFAGGRLGGRGGTAPTATGGAGAGGAGGIAAGGSAQGGVGGPGGTAPTASGGAGPSGGAGGSAGSGSGASVGGQSGQVGNGGVSGGGAGGASSVALVPDNTGWVDATTNPLGAQGAWHYFGDAYGANGLPPGGCQAAGYATSQCSEITLPVPGSVGFPQTVPGKMCTTGTAAEILRVIGNQTVFNYGAFGGAGIGLDLGNQSGFVGTFDAKTFGVVGISFDIDVASVGLRVEFPSLEPSEANSGPDYWGASASYPNSPVAAGTNVVPFSAVRGPMGHVFDGTAIKSILFHVTTNTGSARPYSFCISNLKMLRQ